MTLVPIATAMAPPAHATKASSEPDADGALVERARRGDDDAFADLVRRHEEAVRALCHRVLGSAEDAEDAAQDAFVKAWSALARFDTARPFRPWVLRIASNCALERCRRRRRGARVIPLDDLEVDPPDRAIDARRRYEAVHTVGLVERIVADMPEPLRALFHLRYREELPLDEIARCVGRTPGHVAVILHRLRERIRSAIALPRNEE